MTYHEFEAKEIEHISPKTGEKTKSKMTARDDVKKDVVPVHAELQNDSKTYLKHSFLIETDKHEWKNILSNNDDVIFHMDYSENISGSPKYEVRDAHFNKRQYTLHCTVAHHAENNDYIYHLSGNRSHNAAFSFTVINDLMSMHNGMEVVHFKSDNCPYVNLCKPM